MEDVFFKIYHEEEIRRVQPSTIDLINTNHKFVTGHVAYKYSKKVKSDDTIFITIIREPVAQLISHLNHISNEPIETLPPLVLKIRNILDSNRSEEIFSKMDEEALDFFTNPQSKALISRGDDWKKYFLNPAGAYKEIQSNYEYLGITEAIPEFLERVFTGLKISIDGVDLNFRSNVKKKSVWHKCAISQQWIEQLLSLDLAVYQMLKKDISVNKNFLKNSSVHDESSLG